MTSEPIEETVLLGHGLRPASRAHAGDGDALQQGGALVVDARGIVAMVHRSEFIADNADPSDLVEAALKLVLVGSPAAQRGIV